MLLLLTLEPCKTIVYRPQDVSDPTVQRPDYCNPGVMVRESAYHSRTVGRIPST